MTKLRDMINSGELGTILHCEATMTFPNGLFLKPDAWRASKDETPCGGLTPLGVHAVDGFIDLCGEIDQVYAQSFRRVVEVDADDTTSILFRMKDGMSGCLFGNCTYKPVKGPAETWQADPFDVARAALDAFARAAAGGEPFMIPTAEIVHGAAVTEAIVNSAGSGQPEKL